ncbi:MAG: phosphodiester glycosidase family protein [Chitinophagales bacterium]
MKTKGFGNIKALVIIGGFIGALFAIDSLTSNGNMSVFQFPGMNTPLNQNSNGNTETEAKNNSIQKSPDTQISTNKNTQESFEGQTFRGASYDSYIIDLQTDDIGFFLKDKNKKNIQSFHQLDLQLQQENKKLLFATNGGMFTSAYEPVGLYIENGQVVQPINLKQESGNFFMQPNGIFYITKNGEAHIIPSKTFNDSLMRNMEFATQSGPMLLIDGKIHSKFGEESTNTNIRSGVGIIDDQTVVFAISNTEVNFYDFASFFQQKFGCQNALYLDGVISEMYLPELGRYDSVGKFGVMIAVTETEKEAM